jgi:hypothetical protein
MRPSVLRRLAALAALLAASSLGLLAAPATTRAGSTWEWPLAGTPTVDRDFQPPASQWGAGHRGVDLEGRYGEVVLSAGAGRVTYAGLLAGRGVVTVTHADGLRTTYEPVDATVSVGDLVEAGDALGTLGSGHASCRPGTVCLHWGLLRGRTYLDPLSLVAPGSLRLLPLDAHGAKDKRKRPRRNRSRGKAAEKPVERAAERSAERSVVEGTEKAAERAAARGVASGALRTAAYGAARVAVAAGPEGVVVAVVIVGTVWFLRRRHRLGWW